MARVAPSAALPHLQRGGCTSAVCSLRWAPSVTPGIQAAGGSSAWRTSIRLGKCLCAADDILRTLEGFGLHWDGEVVFQSTRHDRYAEALEGLKQRGFVYPCGCSRKDWAHLPDYPGTCRDGVPAGREAHWSVTGCPAG